MCACDKAVAPARGGCSAERLWRTWRSSTDAGSHSGTTVANPSLLFVRHASCVPDTDTDLDNYTGNDTDPAPTPDPRSLDDRLTCTSSFRLSPVETRRAIG